MMTFADFHRKYQLEEKALNLGDRSIKYPKYGNVLIMAGGAGSGKGAVLEKLLTFRGKVFNVDDIKTALIKLGSNSKLADQFYNETGYPLEIGLLKDPVELAILHDFIKKHKYNDKLTQAFFLAAADRTTKDNVIFDVTLKDISKLREIGELCAIGGYHPVNTHIVWVLTDVETALSQNQQRARSVSDSILVRTHQGAAMTIKQIVDLSDTSVVDGDVWIVFNGATANGRDLTLAGNVVEGYTAYQLKQQGKPFKPVKQIEQAIIEKINSYVPKDAQWAVD